MYKLRELKKEDMQIINRWRNDPELISCLGAPFRYINQEVDDEWFRKYMQSRGNAVRCAIVEETSEENILGLVSLLDINSVNRSGVFNIMIGDSANRGKGIGSFAVNAMLNHAFNNLNLRRVELGVLETNAVAKHLYEKAGFIQEGIKRESNYKNGKYVNMIMMGILKDEFEAIP